ncbi:hypothetical protein Tco_0278362, partial [Tanacetum coccineum]
MAGRSGNVMVLYASVHHDIPIVVNVSGRYKMDRHCGAFGKRLFGKSEKDGFIDIKSKTGDIHLFPVFRISHGRDTVEMEEKGCSEVTFLAKVMLKSKSHPWVWNYMKVFAGLPRVSSSLDSIVDYIIPISKRRFARGHRVYQVYCATQVAYLYIQEDEEHDGVCASLEPSRFDYLYLLRRRPMPSLCLGCRYTLGTSLLNSWNSDVACLPFGSLKMSDAERVDMGSQAETSSSSKRDMGSYSSTMKPSDVKTLTHKYKIPRDLHPVAVSSEWTMDRLDDDCIGLYEQYFEFAGLRKWKGRFFFIDRRAIPDAMCWRHHDSDISDPAPKDGFDEADVVTLTHQPIDIRGIPSGLLFSAGLAVTWEFPKFYPLFKDPEGNVITMSEYLRLPFLSGMTIEAGRALTEQDVIPQHTTSPLSSDEPIPGKTDSQQRVEASDPKIVATRIRKAQAAAKRKTGKNRGSEGASGPERGSKRRKEKATDHIPCPTPLQTIEGVTSDASRGENVVSPTQAQGDNLLEIPPHDSANTTTHPCEEHHDEHSGVVGTGD